MIKPINKEEDKQTTTSGSSATTIKERDACSQAVILDLKGAQDPLAIKDEVSITDHAYH
jgi:hypothetical protein